jgi:hypothetical protein
VTALYLHDRRDVVEREKVQLVWALDNIAVVRPLRN